MKLFIASTIATVFGLVLSVAGQPPAAIGPYSPACKALQDNLQQNATLAQCRTLAALGLQPFAISYQNQTDPAIFLPNLNEYCARPRCPDSLYAQVYADLKSVCGNDMATVTNDYNLAATAYAWYVSPPQHDAICLLNSAGTSCWADIINALNQVNFLPYNLPSQKDLWDYSVYFLPVADPRGIPNNILCGDCLKSYAIIFHQWYTTNPATYNLSNSGLTSSALQSAIDYAYQSTCGLDLSNATLPTAAPSPALAPVSSGTVSSPPTPSSSTAVSAQGNSNEGVWERSLNGAYGSVAAAAAALLL